MLGTLESDEPEKKHLLPILKILIKLFLVVYLLMIF